MTRSLCAALAALLLQTTSSRPAPPIEEGRLRAHVAFLADDLLEGRGPGTRGGRLAEKYVAASLAASGVLPAGENGTFFQKVPFIGVSHVASKLTFAAKGETLTPVALDDYGLWTETQRPVVETAGDLVFVGYGIEAPESRWDDFKGLDVAGKVLVMLVSDPPATKEEPDLFGGRALTYYGRWTYKYESAARHGARGALLVHTDASAGYGWGVIRSGASGERSQFPLDPAGPKPLELAGWLSEPFARRLLAAAGADLDALTRAAQRRDFKPVPLAVKLTASLTSKLRPFEAANVIGRVPGRDAKLKDEAVIFGAHLDHLGVAAPDEKGDAIYNGAVDDASGVASLLEIARSVALEGGWGRSVYFLAVTAEEQGLKGSAWYAAHPAVPPGKTQAYVNLDGAKPWGEVEDFVLMGADRSPELSEVGARVARELKFTPRPDAYPEKGYFFRSDHFSLARVGIPCFNLEMGTTLRGKPAGTGAALEDAYRQKRYHQPTDELDATWDMRALVQYATVGRELGRGAAALPRLATWRPGDEFAAARTASLGQAPAASSPNGGRP